MTPSKPLYETGVIHGRFQILHNDHMKYLKAGKARCKHLVIGITNPDPHLTQSDTADPDRSLPAYNPLTYFERYTMIRDAMTEAQIDLHDFSITPMPINYPELYRYYIPLDAVFFLTIYDDWGRRKRAFFESLGLKIHVLWDVPPDQKGISGKDVRALMVDGQPWRHLVPNSTASLIDKWRIPKRLSHLSETSETD